ncbi:hypothetical protein Tsubulata_007974 [Turnera subulata]|uniref:C3H1-type domain-containing protein n=1 Tax=Turnera subulata TaxID=218843 RepID=A0A9Q0JK05_9ROSI|nr:hypothetical protein Tsubulata_007974 [Turnera subulata]
MNLMASPSSNGQTPTETLNPSATTTADQNPNCPMDSEDPTKSAEPHIQPSNAQSVDDSENNNQGEKRKREVEEEEVVDDAAQAKGTADPSLHPLHKTSLCSYFRRNQGSCSHGSTCRYAHGEGELRPRPDNTWDPTSERAKKAMRVGEVEDGAEKEGQEIMMTDAVADDDGEGDGEGGCLDPSLSKCLVHLPQRWQSDNLKKFLTDEGIQFKSAKKKKGMMVGFVTFETTEQVRIATEELEGKSAGGKNIKVSDVIPRSYDQKIKSAMALPQSIDSALDPEKNELVPMPSDGSGSKSKSARAVVTPLADLPYQEQLDQKKNSVMQILIKLTRNARKACPAGVSIPEWILKSREIGGLACQLEGILESPLKNGYRNKCEFSVGHSLKGKPTVGFMLGNFREGVTAVEEPVDCPNVSRIACKYALIFQEFLQQSELPIWNRFKNTGFWRQLTVREGRLPEKATDVESPEVNISEVMLMVQVSSKGFDHELVTGELRRLALVFSKGAAETDPPLPLTALVLQDHQGISNVAPADAPLRPLCLPNTGSGSEVEVNGDVAEARIHDHISNLRFSISPTAFFQVNSLAAEKLYALAGDWAGLGPDTLLFDVCCGTGTIGLTLAHRVGMVVGIEMNASAVSDAHRNAEINGIKNCRFVCGKAEDVMGSLLKEYINVPQKNDKLLGLSEAGKKAVPIVQEKDTSVDNLQDANRILDLEVENGDSVSRHSENGGEEPKNTVEKGCTTENESSSQVQFKNFVAIVDPPRGGLHPTVIKSLRTHEHLRRLVYISCNPETLMANAIELCTPSSEESKKGNNRAWRKMGNAGLARHRAKSMPMSEPFRPVKAMAVDLFPHSAHCEMVMLLER